MLSRLMHVLYMMMMPLVHPVAGIGRQSCLAPLRRRPGRGVLNLPHYRKRVKGTPLALTRTAPGGRQGQQPTSPPATMIPVHGPGRTGSRSGTEQQGFPCCMPRPLHHFRPDTDHCAAPTHEAAAANPGVRAHRPARRRLSAHCSARHRGCAGEVHGTTGGSTTESTRE